MLPVKIDLGAGPRGERPVTRFAHGGRATKSDASIGRKRKNVSNEIWARVSAAVLVFTRTNQTRGGSAAGRFDRQSAPAGDRSIRPGAGNVRRHRQHLAVAKKTAATSTTVKSGRSSSNALALPHLLGESRRTQLSSDKQTYGLGDRVTLFARVYDQGYSPVTDPSTARQSFRRWQVDRRHVHRASRRTRHVSRRTHRPGGQLVHVRFRPRRKSVRRRST